MPALADLTKTDLSGYAPSAPVLASTPPTIPANDMEPGLNAYLRCPLPPVWQSSPDSLRQFYRNNQVPQVRLFNPPPIANVAPSATSATATVAATTNVTNVSNITNTVSFNVTQNILTVTRFFAYVADPDTTPPTGANVFQNTDKGARLVTVSADLGGGGFHGVVYCDSNPSPTTQVAQFSRVNAGSSPPNYYPGSVTFMVPVGYYYGISVTNGSGLPFIRTWTEWTLGA